MLARAARCRCGESGGRGRRQDRGPRRARCASSGSTSSARPSWSRHSCRRQPIGSTRCDRTRCSSRRPRCAGSTCARETSSARRSGLADVTLRVAGELDAGATQRFAVMDIAGVQAAFGRHRTTLARVDLRLAPRRRRHGIRGGPSQPAAPGGRRVDGRRRALAASADLSRSYRVNLQVLALVALFTGGLLVFSTQALAVVRRRAQFALLRVLGLTRRRLATLIVAEGAMVGAAAARWASPPGFALAVLALRSFGGDLGSGYFRGVIPDAASPMRRRSRCSSRSALRPRCSAASCRRSRPRAPRRRRRSRQATRSSAFARLRSPWPGLVALADRCGGDRAAAGRGLPLAGLCRHRAAARRHADAAAAALRSLALLVAAAAARARAARLRWRSSAARRASSR